MDDRSGFSHIANKTSKITLITSKQDTVKDGILCFGLSCCEYIGVRRLQIFSSLTVTSYLTMFTWSSSFSREISLIAVLGTPSESLQKMIILYNMKLMLSFICLPFRSIHRSGMQESMSQRISVHYCNVLPDVQFNK